jgi:hypothetical protein
MMDTSASRPVFLQSHRKRWPLSVWLVLAVFSSLAIWLAHVSMRRSCIGKTDPETGCRFTFTIGSEWSLAQRHGSGFSEKLDDLTFSLPQPTPLQTWFEKYLLRRVSYPYKFTFLKNEVLIRSGDRIRSGTRSPFRNFELQGGFPTPRYPDFVDLPRTTVMEERHLLVSGQPALWRVSRVDLPLNPTAPVSRRKGSYKFYSYALVVKAKDKDLWFAVTGSADQDHQRQVRKEVRAVGDSLRIEKVRHLYTWLSKFMTGRFPLLTAWL